ncbi:MAG: GAF domain-containing protein, partial [Capsulimonas sp.]|uniref:GAF domain-containing protein n=1 Tax=Capsulimonas sp. TaxID=2494211 RepID=UPI00326499EE
MPEFAPRDGAEQTPSRLRILVEASRQFNSSLDYETVLQKIADALVHGFADWCAVSMSETPLDGEVRVNRLATAHADPQQRAWGAELSEKIGTAPSPAFLRVLSTGRSEFNPEVTEEMVRAGIADSEVRDAILSLRLRSSIAVPMTARGQTFGVITLITAGDSGRTFTENDLVLAEDLAQRAAVAVDNAQLLGDAQEASRVLERELERRRQAEERLSVLAEAASSLIGSLHLSDLLPAVLSLSRRLFDADAYAVWRRAMDGSWGMMSQTGLSEEFARNQTPPGGHAAPSEPTLIEDVALDERMAPRLELLRGEGVQSVLVLPLVLHGETTGTFVFYYRQPRKFEALEVRVASALGNLAASAITTVELYEEQNRLRAAAEQEVAERKRVERENTRLLRESRAAANQQRKFLRDVLASVTEGKLHLCSSPSDLPRRLAPFLPAVSLVAETISQLRRQTVAACENSRLPEDRTQDLITAVSEVAMNAVVHGGGGNASVGAARSGALQVWIEDQGQGIHMDRLPLATLERG